MFKVAFAAVALASCLSAHAQSLQLGITQYGAFDRCEEGPLVSRSEAQRCQAARAAGDNLREQQRLAEQYAQEALSELIQQGWVSKAAVAEGYAAGVSTLAMAKEVQARKESVLFAKRATR